MPFWYPFGQRQDYKLETEYFPNSIMLTFTQKEVIYDSELPVEF